MFKPVIVAFHKPRGYVVSKSDKFNKTIFDILPKSWKEDFYYIWRLDKDSDGLLLLTNVPSLVNEIEHPSKGILKIYEVEIDKPFKTYLREKFKKGVWVTEDGQLVKDLKSEKWKNIPKDLLKVYDIHYQQDKKWKHLLRIVLEYWKKRHIRRLLKAFGYKVKRLTRIKHWKYELGRLKPGQYRIYPLKRRPGKKVNII